MTHDEYIEQTAGHIHRQILSGSGKDWSRCIAESMFGAEDRFDFVELIAKAHALYIKHSPEKIEFPGMVLAATLVHSYDSALTALARIESDRDYATARADAEDQRRYG